MTQQQTFQTGATPTIIVEKCMGDLTVRAWDQPELEVRAGGNDLNVTQNENEFRCKIFGGGIIQLPKNTRLQIREVHGNAKLSDVQGEIQIESVGGSCRIRESGPAAINNVGGDLSAQAIGGPFQLHNVGGTVRLRQVAGDVHSNNIGGDATLVDIDGSVRLENAGGDVSLRQIGGQVHVGHTGGNFTADSVTGNLLTHTGGALSLKRVDGNINAQAGGDASIGLWLHAPQNCHIRAEGDLVCRLPISADATVQLHSGGRTSVKHLDTSGMTTDGPTGFVLGTGESNLNLSAGGNLTLLGADPAHEESAVEFEFDFGRDFAEQIAAQVEIHMEQITQQLDEKLSQMGDGDEIATRVHDRVQHAMHKAEEKIARALQYAEKRIRDAERKAEKMNVGSRRTHRWIQGHHPPTPPTPPRPPKPPRPPAPSASPVSDEERMMILRMVEQGKISIEEAETLLSALDE